MSRNLLRTDSICRNPHLDLLKHVIENNLRELDNLLSRNEELVSEIYGHPYNKPILYVACKDKAKHVSTNTIDILVKHGANLQFSDPAWDGKQALHFATLGQNPNILRCIIAHIGTDNINSRTSNGNTALQLLIKEGNPEENGFEECAQILLDNGLDVNATDNKNAPPVYWAAKKELIGVIKLLLGVPDIDLDSYVSRKKTPRDLLKELNFYVDDILTNANHKSDAQLLLEYVKERKEEEFLQLASEMTDIGENYEGCDKTLLQYACEKNLLKVVTFLLDRNVDPNRVTIENTKAPVLIAATNGFYKIFEELLRRSSICVGNNVLSVILRKLDYESNDQVDYPKCFEILMNLKGNSLDVNCTDENNNFPLHYGARYGGPEVALTLLAHKASLANRNKFGFLNIADVDYDTLKEHFDTCIEVKPRNEQEKENMTITFDYKTLLPSKKQEQVLNDCSDGETNKTYSINETRNVVGETDVVLYMSKSSELKTLLKHPLITSFLFMKWHRIRWIFYANLLFYLSFCLSLLLYTLVFYNEEKSHGYAFCYVFLLVMTTGLLLREVFQITVAPKKYFSNFENYIEISLIILVGSMLFGRLTPDTKTQICAFVFLLLAFELQFLLGSHPDLSTNIVMLRTVSSNFLKFLFFYSILIIAFAFCFLTLFTDNTKDAPNNSTEVTAEDQEYFNNPFMSMFKTIIMLTGEFEAGDLNFDHYPVTSRLIFLAFVMTIAIILLNLLNGLAVSDTQEIKNEAELVAHIARTEYVAYAESLVFTNTMLTKLTNCYYKMFSCRERKLLKFISNSFADKICLHPRYLDNYKLTVYPNQNGKVSPKQNLGKTCGCRNVYLDRKTVRKARLLVQEKKDNEKLARERTRVNDMLLELLGKIDELTKMKTT